MTTISKSQKQNLEKNWKYDRKPYQSTSWLNKSALMCNIAHNYQNSSTESDNSPENSILNGISHS